MAQLAKVYWPLNCGYLESGGYLVGYNIRSLEACVVTVVHGVSLVKLRDLLEEMAVAPEFDDFWKHFGGPPSVLGEWTVKDNKEKRDRDREKDMTLTRLKQTSDIWLTIESAQSNGGAPWLRDVRCCGYRYRVTAQLILYNHPGNRTHSWIGSKRLPLAISEHLDPSSGVEGDIEEENPQGGPKSQLLPSYSGTQEFDFDIETRRSPLTLQTPTQGQAKSASTPLTDLDYTLRQISVSFLVERYVQALISTNHNHDADSISKISKGEEKDASASGTTSGIRIKKTNADDVIDTLVLEKVADTPGDGDGDGEHINVIGNDGDGQEDTGNGTDTMEKDKDKDNTDSDNDQLFDPIAILSSLRRNRKGEKLRMMNFLWSRPLSMVWRVWEQLILIILWVINYPLWWNGSPSVSGQGQSHVQTRGESSPVGEGENEGASEDENEDEEKEKKVVRPIPLPIPTPMSHLAGNGKNKNKRNHNRNDSSSSFGSTSTGGNGNGGNGSGNGNGNGHTVSVTSSNVTVLRNLSCTIGQVDFGIRRMLSLRKLYEEMLRKGRYSNIGCAINLHFFNSIWLMIDDVVIGVVLGMYIYSSSDTIVNQLAWTSRIFNTDAVADQMRWLMGWPAGFKLNDELDEFMAAVFLFLLSVWKSFLGYIVPHIPKLVRLFGVCGIFGVSTLTAICFDILTLSSVYIYFFYKAVAGMYSVQVSLLKSLWYLFRGHKVNVLRLRIDSCDYDMDQLLLGTLFFTVNIFLIPTTSFYYLFFVFDRLMVVIGLTLLKSLLALLNHFPVYGIAVWLFNPTGLPGGVTIESLGAALPTGDGSLRPVVRGDGRNHDHEMFSSSSEPKWQRYFNRHPHSVAVSDQWRWGFLTKIRDVVVRMGFKNQGRKKKVGFSPNPENLPSTSTSASTVAAAAASDPSPILRNVSPHVLRKNVSSDEEDQGQGQGQPIQNQNHSPQITRRRRGAGIYRPLNVYFRLKSLNVPFFSLFYHFGGVIKAVLQHYLNQRMPIKLLVGEHIEGMSETIM